MNRTLGRIVVLATLALVNQVFAGPPGGRGGGGAVAVGVGAGGGGYAVAVRGGGYAHPVGRPGWNGGYPGVPGGPYRGNYWGNRYPGPGYWGGGVALGLGLGYGLGYGYPYPYAYPSGYPFGYPYGYSATIITTQPAPQVFVQQEQLAEAPVQNAPATSYWYYCTQPAGYFPYVQNCSQPWMQVVPQIPPGQPSVPAPSQ